MDQRKVREGLELLFWGNICAVAAFIPIFGWMMLLAGFVIQLIGLVRLKKQDPYYEFAFYLVIAGIILSFFRSGNGMTATVFGWLGMIVSCAQTYMVCTGTQRCVRFWSPEAADYCASVRLWYVVCTAAALIIDIVAQIPIIGVVAWVMSLLIAVVQIAASVRYLIMLWKCKNVL